MCSILVLSIIIGFFVGIYMYNTEENEKEMKNDIENIEKNNIFWIRYMLYWIILTEPAFQILFR